MQIYSMKNLRLILSWITISILVFNSLPAWGQTENNLSLPEDLQPEALRVYIDYSESDNTERFLRSEINFVSHVRDPNLAQLHVFITEQNTGSGGKRLLVSFIGKEQFFDQNQTLSHYSTQAATDIEKREGLCRIVKMGLMPYVAQTILAENLNIEYKEKKIKAIPELSEDGWDYWVFTIDVGGGMNAEQSVQGYSMKGALNADRVTEIWKIKNEFELIYEEEKFTSDEESLTSTLRTWQGKSEIIRSLSSRWSAGILGSIYATTYKNIRLGFDLSTGLEYNIFPWEESERKLFTLGYRFGYMQNSYRQFTIYNKIRESLLFHALIVEVQMAQPWGEIDFQVEGKHYPEMTDNYSIQLESDIRIRLSSAWAVVMEARFESIHDQIYLPRGDATLEEILLKRRQLATTYDMMATIGLSFTFGSIYNNVINRRM